MSLKVFSTADAILFLAWVLVSLGVIWAIGYARKQAIIASRDPYTEWLVPKWRGNEQLGRLILGLMMVTFVAWLLFR